MGFDPCRVWQHSFLEIDDEIFPGHSLPSADSRRAVVSFWSKNVHTKRTKPAQEMCGWVN